MKNKKLIISVSSALAVILSAAVTFAVSIKNAKTLHVPQKLTTEEQNELDFFLNTKYSQRKEIITRLPYRTVSADLNIHARSAILVDINTGNILFEKNADELIPPASMTKLVEMFVVFEEINTGRISLDDIVPLPPQSWWRNLPSDASKMYIDEGHIVTLRELLLGLSIASGNDASIAIANYVCSDMDTFVKRMNEVIKSIGLEKTHFVESSGYSEKNITTAREFSKFCMVYIKKFPFALEQFHSIKKLVYPQEKNLSAEQKKLAIKPVEKKNTNKLLETLPGCNGLKTGYIDESGYNISVTATRGNKSYLSITMGGPGTNTKEGDKYRVLDGTELMEFAFKKFSPYKAKEAHTAIVNTLGTQEKSILLVPAVPENFSIPFDEEELSVTVTAPEMIYGAVKCGKPLGKIIYSLHGQVLFTIPLVASKTCTEANSLMKLYDRAVFKFAK